jgi:hypothetical protein
LGARGLLERLAQYGLGKLAAANSARAGGLVDRVSVTPYNGYYGDDDRVVIDRIDQPISHISKLDLVAISTATQLSSWHPRILEAFRELILELLPDSAVELLPLLEGGCQKLEAITHPG